MTDFTFITTCKGRLGHLQQSLPLLAGLPDSTCIVVDYNCPEHSGDWVEANFPQVKVVRETQATEWSGARARNLGARYAQTEWLIFIDADILLTGDYLGWLRTQLAPGLFFSPTLERGKVELFGTFACRREDFERIEGYDDNLIGWGKEDVDIYYRLERIGCKKTDYPKAFFELLKHEDEERIRFTPYQSRWVSQMISALYLQMKYDVESIQLVAPDAQTRARLYELCRSNILRMIQEARQGDYQVSVELGEHPGVPTNNPVWGIKRKLVYTIRPHQKLPL